MKGMKIALRVLFGVAAVSTLWAATPAAAITISDSIDPTDTLITSGITPSSCPSGFTCITSALSFVHDITDNGFVVGDAITTATIAIHLTEQVVTGANNETYRYDIGTVPQTFTCGAGNCVPNGGVTGIITLSAASLADLAADGKISVTVTSLNGNFLFADSLLVADPPTNGVPEPSTLLLFGAGLAGLGSRFRRRR